MRCRQGSGQRAMSLWYACTQHFHLGWCFFVSTHLGDWLCMQTDVLVRSEIAHNLQLPKAATIERCALE
jgi:hypothetical protein